MSLSLAEHFDISPQRLFEQGAFNSLLDDDSPYFIDPRLVFSSANPELDGAMDDVAQWFSGVVALVKASSAKGDTFWKRAKQMLMFKEPSGLCIGYGDGSTAGRGIGSQLADDSLQTVHEFMEAGLDDPRLFEFLVVIQEGIGPDRLSDMLARILYPRLLSYSERVFSSANVPTETVDMPEGTFSLPRNPVNGKPIVLVPADVLRALPSFHGGYEFRDMWDSNESLRAYFNGFLAQELKDDVTRVPKAVIRDALLRKADVARAAIDVFWDLERLPYDFQDDPAGYQLFADKALGIARDFPLQLEASDDPVEEEVVAIVLSIVDQFKQLIEENGLWTLLRDKDGSLRAERYAQKLFFAVARAHCEANDLAISPEANSGRGCVDFKFGRGYSSTVLVEMKLASNSKVREGYELQLAAYEKAENASASVFLLIDYLGNDTIAKDLEDLRQARLARHTRAPHLRIVDAREHATGSKLGFNDSEEE